MQARPAQPRVRHGAEYGAGLRHDLPHIGRLIVEADPRGAEYPAEHNVGHLYPAKPALARFYRELDPTNSFNPGIGQTSKKARWDLAS